MESLPFVPSLDSLKQMEIHEVVAYCNDVTAWINKKEAEPGSLREQYASDAFLAYSRMLGVFAENIDAQTALSQLNKLRLPSRRAWDGLIANATEEESELHEDAEWPSGDHSATQAGETIFWQVIDAYVFLIEAHPWIALGIKITSFVGLTAAVDWCVQRLGTTPMMRNISPEGAWRHARPIFTGMSGIIMLNLELCLNSIQRLVRHIRSLEERNEMLTEKAAIYKRDHRRSLRQYDRMGLLYERCARLLSGGLESVKEIQQELEQSQSALQKMESDYLAAVAAHTKQKENAASLEELTRKYLERIVANDKRMKELEATAVPESPSGGTKSKDNKALKDEIAGLLKEKIAWVRDREVLQKNLDTVNSRISVAESKLNSVITNPKDLLAEDLATEFPTLIAQTGPHAQRLKTEVEKYVNENLNRMLAVSVEERDRTLERFEQAKAAEARAEAIREDARRMVKESQGHVQFLQQRARVAEEQVAALTASKDNALKLHTELSEASSLKIKGLEVELSELSNRLMAKSAENGQAIDVLKQQLASATSALNMHREMMRKVTPVLQERKDALEAAQKTVLALQKELAVRDGDRLKKPVIPYSRLTLHTEASISTDGPQPLTMNPLGKGKDIERIATDSADHATVSSAPSDASIEQAPTTSEAVQNATWDAKVVGDQLLASLAPARRPPSSQGSLQPARHEAKEQNAPKSPFVLHSVTPPTFASTPSFDFSVAPKPPQAPAEESQESEAFKVVGPQASPSQQLPLPSPLSTQKPLPALVGRGLSPAHTSPAPHATPVPVPAGSFPNVAIAPSMATSAPPNSTIASSQIYDSAEESDSETSQDEMINAHYTRLELPTTRDPTEDAMPKKRARPLRVSPGKRK